VSLVFWSCYLLLLRPFVSCNDLVKGRRAIDFRGVFLDVHEIAPMLGSAGTVDK
jgi:hypothetical protein